MNAEDEISTIQSEWLEDNRKNVRWIIVETEEGYEVHYHTEDSVAPPTTYPTKRLAAARVLQLLRIGPVAPQSHPECVCIEYVESTP